MRTFQLFSEESGFLATVPDCSIPVWSSVHLFDFYPAFLRRFQLAFDSSELLLYYLIF
jgi:hypothetical protein